MSVVKIRAALETALNAMSPALSTSFENASFVPVAGTPYQEATVLFADPDNLEFGSTHRELGFMQVKLKYPQGNGTSTIAARAQLIRTTFYRGASFTNGGVTTVIEKTPTIGTGSIEGDRFVIPVKIRFFANIV